MQADEIKERINEIAEMGSAKTLAAFIAAVAALLAVAILGGSNAAEDKANENIHASDTWAFYQAKTARQTQLRLAAKAVSLALQAHPDLPESVQKAYRDTLHRYRATIDRYESEPETGEGKTELIVKAREHEAARDRADRQGPWFDGAEAALQLAIVLASVAAIINVPALLIVSGALATAGAVAKANGYWLFF
jgi:hypothetical protein